MFTAVALIVVFIAGTILAITNENEEGIMHLFGNPWSALIVLKHSLIGVMVLLQAWSFFILQPRLAKLLKSGENDGTAYPAVKKLWDLDNVSYVLTALLGCGVLLIIAIVLAFY
jgi:hypothetical protein